MSDFTIDDNTAGAKVLYVIEDREIYNDIRSRIGTLTSESVLDENALYTWQVWTRAALIAPSKSIRSVFSAFHLNPIEWRLESHEARSRISPYGPYYAYSIALVDVVNQPRMKAIELTNNGNDMADFEFVVKYKYLRNEYMTHDPETGFILTARAYDLTSIKKYGRRVMNLTWAEGTDESTMQTLVDYYLARYKEPVARLPVRLVGVTDVIRTQIITREISDRITINYTNLGFNDDCFIDSISIEDGRVGMAICRWGLIAMRDDEKLSIFTLDTSELDGPDILGS